MGSGWEGERSRSRGDEKFHDYDEYFWNLSCAEGFVAERDFELIWRGSRGIFKIRFDS